MHTYIRTYRKRTYTHLGSKRPQGRINGYVYTYIRTYTYIHNLDVCTCVFCMCVCMY